MVFVLRSADLEQISHVVCDTARRLGTEKLRFSALIRVARSLLRPAVVRFYKGIFSLTRMSGYK